jgi:hypothetical protein
MDLSKLRRGELIAALGGVVLLISLLFINWYGIKGVPGQLVGFGAWDDQGFLGTIANLVILAAGLAAVSLAILTATARTVALPVATSALTAGLGAGATVMVLLRMVFEPDVHVLVFTVEDVTLRSGIYIALVSAIAVAIGGWESMQEESSPAGHQGEPHPPAPPPEGSPPARY